MSASHGSRPVRGAEEAGADRRGLALAAARVLYVNGVETARVIASGEQVARRLDVPGELEALWGSLQLVAADHTVSVQRARPEGVNMRAAQAASDAIAAFDAGALDRAGLERRVRAAAAAPGPPLVPFTVAAALGAVALVLLWGLDEPSGLAVVAVAAAAGALARRGLQHWRIGPVWQVFAAALIGGLAGAVVGATTSWSPGELVALGPALVLVPGPQLLNGGLDLSAGRITLGIARLTYAAITILAISAGLLLGLAATGRTLPVIGPVVALPLAADVACAAVAAAAYAVFFDLPWRLLPVPVLVGSAAHLLHSVLADELGWNLAVASGIGALLAGAVLIPVADRLRVPFAGIGFASVVSMVPSTYVHRAASGVLQLVGRRDADPRLLQEVVADGATAVLVIAALVLGVVVPLRLHRAIRDRGPSV